jgi:hypothetical protein
VQLPDILEFTSASQSSSTSLPSTCSCNSKINKKNSQWLIVLSIGELLNWGLCYQKNSKKIIWLSRSLKIWRDKIVANCEIWYRSPLLWLLLHVSQLADGE